MLTQCSHQALHMPGCLERQTDRQTDRDRVVQLPRHGITKVSGRESFNNSLNSIYIMWIQNAN